MRAMSSTNASSVASCSHRASSSSASPSSRAHVRRIDSSARAGRPSARAFELDSVRAHASSPGVPAHRRARLAIVTAMSDAVARGDGDDDGDAGPSRAALGRTRLQRVVDSFRKQSLKRAKRNLTKLPLALISLLVGFSVCALLPHPESPQDAFISFTIILLSEFVSSVLYGGDNQGGILRWVRDGDWLPTVLNCFKIGVLYGLFCDAFKMSSSSTLASCSPRVTIEINDALRDVLRATSESSDADESLRRRASVAARETTVDYRVVFDACAHARRTMRKSEWGKTLVRVNARAKSLRFDVDRDAETRELTEEEQTARREHRERMRALRDAVEEQRYEMMTRDVARSRRANANSMSSFAMGVKEETRAYAFAAHVATVMFAFAAAGYVGGGAVERAANGAAWARGLCAALGAALGLFTEAGLMILRESRV